MPLWLVSVHGLLHRNSLLSSSLYTALNLSACRIHYICNTGIRLASGAFQTSRFESLCVESRRTPLTLCLTFPCVSERHILTNHHMRGRLSSLCSNRLHVTALRPAGRTFFSPSIYACFVAIRLDPRPSTVSYVTANKRPSTRHTRDTRSICSHVEPDCTAVYIDGPLFHGSIGCILVSG
jgi:hypothetical protein